MGVEASAAAFDVVPTELHDWSGNEASVLVLNYTMRCPLQCDFCCYSCSPTRTEKMSFDLAARLIREAGELAGFSCVAFTGGEPLSFADEIVALSGICREAGLPFTIATAAHWARTPARARAILEPMVENGLIRLNVSADPSHQKFIPKRSVINALQVANDLGLETYAVGTFTDPDMSLSAFLPGLEALSSVHFVDKYVAAVGRAAEWDITQQRYGLDLSLDNLSCYRRVHHDIVVWHDGFVYPCCSTFNRATPGLRIANARDVSLGEIWELIEGSMMLRVMKRRGFLEFYEIVRRNDPDTADALPDVGRCVGPCSLCNQIFSQETMSNKVKEAFVKYEKEVISNAIEAVRQRYGDVTASRIVELVLPGMCSASH